MLFAFIIFLIKICTLLYPRSPKGKGGILFYLCPLTAINSCWEKCDEKLAYMFNVNKNQKVGKQEVGIWWVQKRFPWYGVPISCYLHLLFFWLKFVPYYTPAPRRGRGVYCFTSVRPSVRPRYFSSHFSQQPLMTEIWYLVTSFSICIRFNFFSWYFQNRICRFYPSLRRL
jgi:hypothetical protein